MQYHPIFQVRMQSLSHCFRDKKQALNTFRFWNSDFVLGHAEFEVSAGHPGRNIPPASGNVGLSLAEKLSKRHSHPSAIHVEVAGQFSSVQFSRSVVSDSLQHHELQHARSSCPSPTPRVHSDSRPLSQWCHPAISSSVVPFSSCPQSLPASESFPMSQLCMRWPEYWSFSFSIISSKEIPGLISFRMDWLDLLAVHKYWEILKS